MAADEDTVVVIEDDHHISDLVAMYLRRDGFRVLQADDGETGLGIVAREQPRLVIVDIGLPGKLDGFDVCRRLGRWPARSGADRPDPHPECPRRRGRPGAGSRAGCGRLRHQALLGRELVARVHAILRRTGQPQAAARPTVVALGPIEVDTGRREVRVAGTPIPLATQEFDLLSYLVDNLGLALSRRQLLNGAWGDDWYGDERTVDVHVRQLRKKLGPDLPLATVWGVGYRLG